jgi:hypothetical protein
MSLRARGGTAAFVRQVLDHYRWGDEHELVSFVAAHEVYDAIWRLYDSQRRQCVSGSGSGGSLVELGPDLGHEQLKRPA